MKPVLIAAACCYFFGGVRRPIFAIGIILHLMYVVSRGLAAGRLPLIGPHDTLVFFSASIAVMAAPLIFSRNRAGLSGFSWGAGFAAGIFTLLSLPFPAFIMPLPPILNTPWFEAHVALAFFAYALFAHGAVLGGLYLVGSNRRLLDLQYRVCLTGYTFFSISMITGGIWGYYAWGTYWLWTPKELWTSILWLFYSLYLHFRLKPGWERIIAWGGIAGFAVTMFTYLGVSMLMKSSHSF